MNSGDRARAIVETGSAYRWLIAQCRPQIHVWTITPRGATLEGSHDRPSDALAHSERLQAAGHTVTVTQDMGRLARLLDSQPGLASGGHGGGDENDPTGNTAGSPDQPAHDLRRLDQHLRAAFVALDTCRAILGNYGPPRPATEADQLALRRDNTKPDPCCEHHARVTYPGSGLPVIEAPDPRRKGPTTCNGRLERPMLLCRWCVNFVGIHNRLPTDDELEQHRDRLTVRVRADESTTRRPA